MVECMLSHGFLGRVVFNRVGQKTLLTEKVRFLVARVALDVAFYPTGKSFLTESVKNIQLFDRLR